MQIDRRTFLRSGLVLPAMGLGVVQDRVGSSAGSSFDPRVEVNAGQMRHNVAEISRRAGGRPILAVIKNNGYGAGLLNAAHILEPLDAVHGFAVVKLQEAVALRDGGVSKPILLMGPFNDAELEDLAERAITPMVYTAIGDSLDRCARKLGRPIDIHVCVDTGIGRVGVPFRQAVPLIRDLATRTTVRLAGTMMTFSEDPEFDREQLRRFQALCSSLENEGLHLGKKHAASSFGLFGDSDAFLDMVRPGMALFGIYSEPEFRTLGAMDLRPAIAFKARVVYVKQLLKGESAGYNRVYRAQEDVWVATIPVGHADGYPRAATKGAKLRIGDRLYPVVAVSASHCVAEVGRECTVSIGDEVALFDGREGSRPEDVAGSCGGSVYDLTMHLSVLLPRRVV